MKINFSPHIKITIMISPNGGGLLMIGIPILLLLVRL